MRQEQPCAQCGALFRPAKKHYRFCSRLCVNDSRRIPGGHRRPLRACEWCGEGFQPTRGVRPGHPQYQSACSRLCGRALRSTELSSPIWPCVCGRTILHRRPRLRCPECPAPKYWSPRRGKPRVYFCRSGCGRADIIPARPGPWTCEDCKELNRKVSRYLRRGHDGKINGWLRDVVLVRDGWRCQLCGGCIPRGQTNVNADTYPHIDHIVPRSLGGPTELDNLQASHRICNMLKGATYVTRPTTEAA